MCILCVVPAARAQNPDQWSGSVEQSVARAQEQTLPLLVWVTGDRDDDDDLDDAQEECFRDPIVVDIIHRRYVPVRVARNSRAIETAARLGLPTEHGLYCAVLTADGRLLDSMGPGEVADPAAFANHLVAASDRYLDDLYETELRPLLEDLSTPKPQARLAAQTVWRLGIRKADGAIVGLLDRPDLTPSERSRLYSALAAIGTDASIEALLDRPDDPAAMNALLRCEPGAIPQLLTEIPTAQDAADPRQLAAYRAVARICRLQNPRADQWWETAPEEARQAELERLSDRAHVVLEYWQQTEHHQN
jgi:hypothetical protein